MISLNNYLYSGDTVVKILHCYSRDLKENAIRENNGVDLAHSNCLIQMIELLEHNEFLTLQSQTIREFYKFMTEKYPYLAFTFKGRIKSLIRLEEKINGNIVEFIYDYYTRTGKFPSEADIKEQIRRIKDLIAYRIVISLPKCHLNPGQNREEIELKHIYEIANALPGFLEERGFDPVISGFDGQSEKIDEQMEKRLSEDKELSTYDSILERENEKYLNLNKEDSGEKITDEQHIADINNILTIPQILKKKAGL